MIARRAANNILDSLECMAAGASISRTTAHSPYRTLEEPVGCPELLHNALRLESIYELFIRALRADVSKRCGAGTSFGEKTVQVSLGNQ